MMILRFVLPSDYVNWVKLYLFKGTIPYYELTENIQVQSATSYLQTGSASFGLMMDRE